MAFDYGFGELENSIIKLFTTYPPDFIKAEELISQGADLNAISKDNEDENVLSEILYAYWDVEGTLCSEADYRTYKSNVNPHFGESMLEIVRFFLEHGFSVEKKDYRYGAQCLASIVLSTFDEYMLPAARLLLDAGAKNAIAYSDENCTALDAISTEGSFQSTGEHDHHRGNIYEAFYQMVLAADEGRPYQGISHYMACYGKCIKRVLATKPAVGKVFYDLNLPSSKHRNCFNQTLFFEYDGGYLITSQYADLWTNTVLPDNSTEDVSKHFPGIVGSVVKRITFGHNEIQKGTVSYGQPVINLEMDSGAIARFTINFGEVESENRAAYFSIVGRRKWWRKSVY